ncbi:helix-turn-helix transcriptional regulator [Dubosiella muris]|uniref:XRE family transcriptional regulator n=1 Tax=Dubosiella muris TaxID=3038133 RepID=A0AC61R6X1_9FIRM|nr:helix-turn-helix transcriptional regulator [Dubosiella muris]TGY65679.1 XRE family transcriptional regulator [Dubosiella muris]
MNLGNNLFHARRKKGYSQEDVAERLGVSRQTISKWETGETIPDVFQAKTMARLYDIPLDELIELDATLFEIEAIIAKTDEAVDEKIDWTSAWAKKYPVLARYPQTINTAYYARAIEQLLNELQAEAGYSDLDTMLVLKDVLYQTWKRKKEKSNRSTS